MQKQARITSKGQITVPREVRRILGMRVGNRRNPMISAEGAGLPEMARAV